MAQTGQTHRRQEGARGKSGSANGARSNGRAGTGERKTRSSANGRKTQSSANGRKTQSSANGRKTQSNGNGRKAQGSSGARRTRASSNGHDGRKRTANAASKTRTRSRQPARKAQRSTQKAARSVRKSAIKIAMPDPRWGIVPLATASVGGAAWAIARKRHRKRTLADRLDLKSAANRLERELGDVTDVAGAAGRRAGRFAKQAGQSAAPATKQFLRARTKEAQSTTKAARGTARSARGTARRLLRGTGSSLREGAKELQTAIPSRQDPNPVARLSRELAEKAPSRVEDVWPLGLALLPAAAYTAARLKAGHRLPIQCSVDVAVPLEVVYDEWMALEFLPEGTHCVTDMERTDDALEGVIKGPLGTSDWEAEILDERDCESFAWRSTEGSDCAGLITFHRLSERLTRLELQLDVLPARSRDAIALVLHTADRRAEDDLRRFKARLETMSPDAYGDSRNPDETDQEEEED